MNNGKVQQPREAARMKTLPGATRRTKQVVQVYTELATMLGFTPDTNNPRAQWQEQLQPYINKLLNTPVGDGLTSAQRTSKNKRRIAELEKLLQEKDDSHALARTELELRDQEIATLKGKLATAEASVQVLMAAADIEEVVLSEEPAPVEEEPHEQQPSPELMPFSGHRIFASQSNTEPPADEECLRLVCVVMSDGRGTYTPTFSYKTNETRDAMLGAAVRFAREQKPTFNVVEVLEAAISNADLVRAVEKEGETLFSYETLTRALLELANAEATYRKLHDLYGDGHSKVGRAWDKMRVVGDSARALLDGAA